MVRQNDLLLQHKTTGVYVYTLYTYIFILYTELCPWIPNMSMPSLCIRQILDKKAHRSRISLGCMMQHLQFLCIFYMSSFQNPPPTHCQLPGDKDASVPPGAMLQCGMCDLFGQRWRLHAVKPQAGEHQFLAHIHL